MKIRSKSNNYRSMLTGRESLIRLIGKRRRFLPNRQSILSYPVQIPLSLVKEDSGTEERSDKLVGSSGSDKVTCPICGKKVRGEEYMINSHLETKNANLSEDCLKLRNAKSNNLAYKASMDDLHLEITMLRENLISVTNEKAKLEDEVSFLKIEFPKVDKRVLDALCSRECIKKVALYTEHIAQLLSSNKMLRRNESNWDKEKQVFEEKINSLFIDIDKLKIEKWKLQHQADDLLVKLTNTKSDFSALEIKCDQLEISSKHLQGVIDSQIQQKYKSEVDYHAVPPPYNDNYTIMPPSMTNPVSNVSEPCKCFKPKVDESSMAKASEVSDSKLDNSIPNVSDIDIECSSSKGFMHEEVQEDTVSTSVLKELETLMKQVLNTLSSESPISQNVKSSGKKKKSKTAPKVSSDSNKTSSSRAKPVGSYTKPSNKSVCAICKYRTHLTHECAFYVKHQVASRSHVRNFNHFSNSYHDQASVSFQGRHGNNASRFKNSFDPWTHCNARPKSGNLD